MDDLDAILADLKSTLTPVSTYESKWETHTTTEHTSESPSESSSRVMTSNRQQHSYSPEPPPVPSLPSKDVLDSLHSSQEFYKSRSPGRPVYSSTIMISKSVYNGDDDHYERPCSVSPGHSRIETSSSSVGDRYGCQTRQPVIQQLSPRPTLLSNNLSELDSLLEDLSSAKFTAEVNRANHNAELNHSISPQPSGTLRPGSAQRSGSLQRELEIPKLIVPSSQQGHDLDSYENVDDCRRVVSPLPLVQGGHLLGQQDVMSGPLQNQYYEVQQTVIPTNVQQPVVEQLQWDPSLSPTSTMQMQRHQQQHIVQQPPLGPAVQAMQPAPLGQGQGLMHQPQGQGFVMCEPQGQFNHSQTTTVQQYRQQFPYQPEPVISQQIQQRQQLQNQSASQAAGNGSLGRTASASRDLEELMMSFSEFDVANSRQGVSEPTYSQPMKTEQMSGSLNRQPVGGLGQDSANRMLSQEQAGAGYLSTSAGSQGAYGSVSSPGSISPGPREIVIQPSPSVVGHPVPSTVFTQNTSRVVISQGMHGVLPQSMNGQGRDGQVETMLGQLETDLNQQGILTIPKGDCAACNKKIVGQVLMALGKIWHPEHFLCFHCNQQLGTNIFFEREGQPYCEKDYQILFSPKCALCNDTILEKCITALNKTWHPDHFFCAHCRRPFSEEGFHEKDGLPFCQEDYFRIFAPKCGGCGNAILSNYVTALHQQWHPECFVCRECQAPFQSGSFFDHNGLPYCEQHFHAHRGSLCAACRQPITGRCIAAMYRKFHPEHFVCVFCLQQLNKGTFKEHSDKPYCHVCFEKLFG